MVRASDGWHSTSTELNSLELVMLAVNAALTVCAAQYFRRKFSLLHVCSRSASGAFPLATLSVYVPFLMIWASWLEPFPCLCCI